MPASPAPPGGVEGEEGVEEIYAPGLEPPPPPRAPAPGPGLPAPAPAPGGAREARRSAARAGALRRRGDAAFYRRAWAEAEAAYAGALEARPPGAAGAGPDRAALLAALAAVRLRLGRSAEALQDARAALLLLEGAGGEPQARLRGALAALRDDDAPAARALLVLPASAEAEVGPPQRKQPARGPAALGPLRAHCAAEIAHRSARSAAGSAEEAEAEAAMRRVLGELAEEAEEADPFAAWAALADLLEGHAACRRAFAGAGGWPVLFAYWTDAFAAPVARILAALSPGGADGGGAAPTVPPALARWPDFAMNRVADMAADVRRAGGSVGVARAAMAAFARLLRGSELAAHAALLQRLGGAEPTEPPLARLLAAAASAEARPNLPVQNAEALARLLGDLLARRQVAGRRSAFGALAAEAGLDLPGALLGLFEAAAEFHDADALDDGDGAVPESVEEVRRASPEQAERFWRREARRQYNRPVVLLRRAALAALTALARDQALLRATAFTKKVAADGATKTVATPFFARLVKALEGLHEAQPSRSRPVLDMRGRPASYEPRKYAADFLANPLGDLLLQDPTGPVPNGAQKLELESEQTREAAESGGTALERCLELLATLAAHPNSAKTLFFLHVCEALRPLHAYSGANVRRLLRQVYGALAKHCPAAADALCGADASPTALTGLVLSGDARLAGRGADGLLGRVADCSGDEFRRLTEPGSALDRGFWLLHRLHFAADPEILQVRLPTPSPSPPRRQESKRRGEPDLRARHGGVGPGRARPHRPLGGIRTGHGARPARRPPSPPRAAPPRPAPCAAPARAR